jgi:hypothetical protein
MFGRTPWTGDQLVARPLPVQKHRKTHTKHSCPEWDLNPRSRLPSERREYMPYTARLPWPASLSLPWTYLFFSSFSIPLQIIFAYFLALPASVTFVLPLLEIESVCASTLSAGLVHPTEAPWIFGNFSDKLVLRVRVTRRQNSWRSSKLL